MLLVPIPSWESSQLLDVTLWSAGGFYRFALPADLSFPPCMLILCHLGLHCYQFQSYHCYVAEATTYSPCSGVYYGKSLLR